MIKIEYVFDECSGKFVAEIKQDFVIKSGSIADLKKEFIQRMESSFDWGVERLFRENGKQVEDVYEYKINKT